ncbi:MAG: sigma-54-dependent Fis family transcriptional regulator [Victivallales bacterium]|nr:sigma-54-dependent Fis family transcriptional regulator [Victivallales bacterium]
MSLFNSNELELARAIGGLNYTNPFTPQRTEQERRILGRRAKRDTPVWHKIGNQGSVTPNVEMIFALCKDFVDRLQQRFSAPSFKMASEEEMKVYDELVVYWLFEKYRLTMGEMMVSQPDETYFPCYKAFAHDFETCIASVPRRYPSLFSPEKTFATYFQIHRAFHFIFNTIAGSSLEAANFRANIWQSIFTCDIYRYLRVLFDKMSNVTTLITGESGTGKELVARAIALSQYIPINGQTSTFACAYPDCFHAIQLSAMPQSILESELFGHVKGAYTGAIADHKGYLETCTPWGTIFLDEIGDINAEVQIKLLRVLQTRSFQRIGEVRPLQFHGKLIAATNRDLHQASQQERFRHDLYYRLCSDTIATVPLRRLVNGNPDELMLFVSILANRILGDEQEAEAFAEESHAWIVKNLGLEYPWPGNVRELEQCLRNLLVRGIYIPPNAHTPAVKEASPDITLTVQQVLHNYMQALFRHEGGNLAKTARAAGVDRRTVRKYL